jgi:hypothetical protein
MWGLSTDLAVGDHHRMIAARFRYQLLDNGHVVDISLGSHVFTTPILYKSEAQSNAGHPHAAWACYSGPPN